MDDLVESLTNPYWAEKYNDQIIQLDKFLNLNKGKRIALVTSGGTTVPLEKQMVRFLDNFSAAKYFLANGYSVIFFHRLYSLQPFSRHYTHAKNCFLDMMNFDDQGNIHVIEEYAKSMKQVLGDYQNARYSSRLLLLTFVTVNDYLFMLRVIAERLNHVGPLATLYLAAAVSDFYIPDDKITEHKIQSHHSGLMLELMAVPKLIPYLVEKWCPRAFIISFKLETDESILEKKCKQSLETNGHQAVIGNLLQTRKHILYVYLKGGSKFLEIKAEDEIEKPLIKIVSELHTEWIERK